MPESSRVELVDGTLVVSPKPTNRHQRLSFRLVALLDAASPEGWEVLGEPDVRLGVDRDVIPDIAVLFLADRDTLVDDAADVALVAEVVSPGHAAYVEPTALTAHLHEPRCGEYVETASGPGDRPRRAVRSPARRPGPACPTASPRR